MGKDIIPAVVTNEEGSGLYLVVVLDSVGSEKPLTKIVLPGQSSEMFNQSIDALAAYSIKDGQPVDLQLLRMGAGDRNGGSAHWWKYPDGSHGAVKLQDGKPVLDMQFNFYRHAPTPSSQKTWGVDELPWPAHLQQPQQGAGLREQLQQYLQQNYSSADARRILNAVDEKNAAPQLQGSASERTA